MAFSKTKMQWFLFSTILLVAVIAAAAYFTLLYRPSTMESGLIIKQKQFTGHGDGIWSLQFSPDGKYIASGSIDSTVMIREKETGKVLYTLKHPAGVTGLEYSHDGLYLVTSSYDEKVRLWLITEEKLLQEFKGHKGTVWSVSISPDGKVIASAGEDRVIRLWNSSTGALLNELKGHSLNIWNVRFSPDGAKLASGSFDTQVKIWDVKTGHLIRNLQGHTEAVVALAFSKDGKLLATASDDKTVKLWDIDKGENIKTLQEGDEHVQAVAFSPDGQKLISGGRDKSTIGEFFQNFLGDSHADKGISMRLWDIRSGRLLQTFSENANDVNDVAWSPDGLFIASGSSDKTVWLYRLKSTEVPTTISKRLK